MITYKTIAKAVVCIGILTGTTACFDLNQSPKDALSSGNNPLSSNSEMQMYLNQFYETAFAAHPYYVDGGIAFGDNRSDNMIPKTPNQRLAGRLKVGDATPLAEYNQIRNANFILLNAGNNKSAGAERDQFVGEAYFFRALFYFHLVQKYGDVAWVDNILTMSEADVERSSRTVIIDHILDDLTKASTLLSKASDNSSMRVHKDVALALKSRVALYEGTWQKYHKQEGDPFFTTGITDEKINGYLTTAKEAAEAVIKSGTWSIFTAGETPYKDMFVDLDLTDNKEVLLWRRYNAADGIGHSVTRYINEGGGESGISLSLVSDYLTKEGTVLSQTERHELQKSYGKDLDPARFDARLSQTVCYPGVQMQPEPKDNPKTFVLPPLHESSYHQNTSGYSLLKYNEYKTEYTPTLTGEGKSQAPAIQFRYAEVLLNYAEALAEIDGARYAGEIRSALQPLRDRAEMPGVDFDREYNTSSDYPFAGLDKYIQAVRRERRVELACEDFRFDDICRWAAADELIIGKRPKGALFAGSDLEKANASNGYYKGKLKVGETIRIDSEGYIDYYQVQMPNGYEFDPKRDYLLPLQDRMISLTNGKWKQNPGWE